MIITNPARFDTERLCINRYITPETPHNCPNMCSLNLCKGKALKEYILEKQFEQIIYCGDGKNDFCPGTIMKASDILFMRKGMGLHRHLMKGGNREKMVCTIVEWGNHEELLESFIRYISY